MGTSHAGAQARGTDGDEAHGFHANRKAGTNAGPRAGQINFSLDLSRTAGFTLKPEAILKYTVSQLARFYGLSRSTILYYESIGLLRHARRTSGNYRMYGDAERERLEQICAYREAGLKLGDIGIVLDASHSEAAQVLHRRFFEIGTTIARLRDHQRSIARLLGATAQLRRLPVITKDKWKDVMTAAGFSQEDMNRWHTEFEKSAPAEHQEFLEFLRIPNEEILRIREESRHAEHAKP